MLRAYELGPEFTLLQDSQDRIAVLEYLGIEDDGEFSSLFVEVLDGEYGGVYGCQRLMVLEDEYVYDVRRWYGLPVLHSNKEVSPIA